MNHCASVRAKRMKLGWCRINLSLCSIYFYLRATFSQQTEEDVIQISVAFELTSLDEAKE
jgi:hypothetical protein